MEYRVVLADSAKGDADNIYAWVVKHAPLHGPKWFEDLMERMYSLESQPFRCRLAREARKAHRDIRCLLFGRQKHVYRILFEVDEKSRTVWILHIRHGARADMPPEDLANPSERTFVSSKARHRSTGLG